MQTSIRRGEYAELAVLFFIQWMALGIWYVPLSPVLDAHGLHAIRPIAFATAAIGALVSPLIFGAMADRHASPVLVLRWLAAASAVTMTLATWSIQHAWPAWLVVALIQALMLSSTPITSISTSIVFSRLRDPKREFGPIRAIATFGWMCGCWLVSALNADASTLSGYLGSAIWLALSAFTFLLPSTPPPPSTGHVTWRERMGWDALVLLKNPNHRVVFIAAAIFSIPLSAFYPFTPPHLQQLGLQHTTAWMTLGQVSEVFAMLGLAGLLAKWRLKWVFATGLAVGVVRFALCMANSKAWVLAGVSLHGFSYTLYFITAQIYLDQRIDPAWRARAQALMSLMTSGIGSLLGYLGVGLWFSACSSPVGTHWSLFWGGLSASVAVILAWFLAVYHGQGVGLRRQKPEAMPNLEG